MVAVGVSGLPVYVWVRVLGVSVTVTAAFAMVTSCCADAVRKFVVAAPLASTLHVPAPVELNVPALAFTTAHGPLTRCSSARCCPCSSSSRSP